MDANTSWIVVLGYLLFGGGAIGAYQMFWWSKQPIPGITFSIIALFGLFLVENRGGVIPENVICTAKDLESGSRWERVERPPVFQIRNLDTGEKVLFRSDTDLNRFEIESEWGTDQWELKRFWKVTEHSVGSLKERPPPED